MGPFPGDDGLNGTERVLKEIEDVRERVMGYYGNEALKRSSPSLAGTLEHVPRPEELTLLETLLVLHTLPSSGAYLDQPWELMQRLEAAAQGKAMYQNAELSQGVSGAQSS